MMDNIFKVLVLFCITTAAVVVGNKFLTIHLDNPFQKEEPAVILEPVVTIETLPEPEEDPVVSEPAPAPTRQPSLDEIRLKIVALFEEKGSQVVDSRTFEDKALCDQAVLTVVDEYKKRGIREQDMAETAPFPDSTGLVWVLQNAGKLNYIGCFASNAHEWAIYVHFVPGGKEPAANP